MSRQVQSRAGPAPTRVAFANPRKDRYLCRYEIVPQPARSARHRHGSRPGTVQRLRLQGQVLADLPVQARREAESAVNSLDPRAKRFRAADKSLQQARLALEGAQIALADLPRSRVSALASALESIDKAAQEIDNAAASLDDARLESTED